MQQFQYEWFLVIFMFYIGVEEMIVMMVEYICQCVVFGKFLISKQVLWYWLVDWYIEIECLWQLIYYIVRMKEVGLDVIWEVFMGKFYVVWVS